MWQKSCLRRSLRRAATIFLTPKAEKTTVVSSLKRAGEEGGCEEVLHPAYSGLITDNSTLQPLSHSLTAGVWTSYRSFKISIFEKNISCRC